MPRGSLAESAFDSSQSLPNVLGIRQERGGDGRIEQAQVEESDSRPPQHKAWRGVWRRRTFRPAGSPTVGRDAPNKGGRRPIGAQVQHVRVAGQPVTEAEACSRRVEHRSGPLTCGP